MTFTERDDFMLSDGAAFARELPHVLWKRLRDQDPVHHTKGPARDYWSVTRHADIQTILSNPLLFSSRRSGVSLPTSAGLADPAQSEHARLIQAGAMLPVLDPPRHAKLRQPFMKRFSPKVVNGLEDRVRSIVRGILAQIPDQQPLDFVVQVAARLPSSMIFLLMDLPTQDWDRLFHYTNMHTAPDDPEFSLGSPIETREKGMSGTFGYCRLLGLKRRLRPGDDLLSMIATMEIDGEKLTEDEVGFLGHMFIVAGQETTRNSLSAGLYQLISNPSEFERLRANPSLLKTAPDEFIRWATPVAHLMRTATARTELGGRTIEAGDWVVCWLAAGNRDERAFHDPDLFDVGRSPNPHLGFGFGPHFCLGAFLGRLQIRVMLEELLEQFTRIEAWGSPEYASSIQFFGMKHFSVSFTR